MATFIFASEVASRLDCRQLSLPLVAKTDSEIEKGGKRQTCLTAASLLVSRIQLPQRSAVLQPLVERNRCSHWSSSPPAVRRCGKIEVVQF